MIIVDSNNLKVTVKMEKVKTVKKKKDNTWKNNLKSETDKKNKSKNKYKISRTMYLSRLFLKWERLSNKKEMLQDRLGNCRLSKKLKLLSLREKEDMRKWKWELSYTQMEEILKLNLKSFNITFQIQMQYKKKTKKKKIQLSIEEKIYKTLNKIKLTQVKDQIDFKEKKMMLINK